MNAGAIKHPLLSPVRLNLRDGVSPDEAAVLAVLLNPALHAARNQRGVAAAQVIQAGILPNPQLTGGIDYVIGGNSEGTMTGFGYGASWDVRALLTAMPNRTAAKELLKSVRLDVAWQEWQTALAGETGVWDLLALKFQVAQARKIDRSFDENLSLVQKAEAAHAKTVLDVSAAEAASQTAHATLLSLEQDFEQRRLALNKNIGFPPDYRVGPQANLELPSRVRVPSSARLLAGLEERRLDLLALKRGYESEDAKLRVAIIEQFPKISVGFNRANDTSNVQTIGPAVTIDLPIFDRNQGQVAVERATRQKLFDEYTARVFEAHSAIASAAANIESLMLQIEAAERALPALQRLVSTYQDALNQGNVDVLSYYTARTNLAQKQIDILKLKQQLALNRVALEAAAAWHFSVR
ncbi:MAG: outer membrane protein heavy metal efflux system [Chthoniobacter sp.]|nr:outer membrane protein heavy metal efflux system [Chthoniobacter sp.]